MITPKEINQQLVGHVRDLCERLIPGGKYSGGEYMVADTNGGKGQSLKVRVDGDRAGVWADFATGEGGDLIDLWAAANGVSVGEAIREAKDYLGLAEPERKTAKAKEYKAPLKPKGTARVSGEVYEYLTETRKLTDKSINAFRVAMDGVYILFPFKDGDDTPMIKRRNIHDKTDTKPTSGGQRPMLFGWQALPSKARQVCIVEGELDAMAAYEYGIPALSVPFGGGGGAKQTNWIETEYANLERFDDIYLALDMDDAGEQAVAEIIDRLGRERCKLVELHRKDINDCLIAGDSAEQVWRAIEKAKTLDPEELRSASEFCDDVIARLYPDPDSKQIGYGLPWLSFNTKLRWRPGELSLFNGVNGHGKSQALGHMVLQCAREGARVCMASMELKPGVLLERMTRQASGITGSSDDAKPSKGYIRAIFHWFENRFWVFNVTGAAKRDRLLEVFEYAYRRYGVDIFVVDSLLMCGLDYEDYTGQTQFVQALCDFKNAHDVHVFLVTHSRKTEGGQKKIGDKQDVRGAGSIADLADNIISVWRNKPKEEEIQAEGEEVSPETLEKPDAILACDKQRNGEWEGKIALDFHQPSRQYLRRGQEPMQFVQYSEVQAA